MGGRFVEDSATIEEIWSATRGVVGDCVREERTRVGEEGRWWGGEGRTGEGGRLVVKVGKVIGGVLGAEADQEEGMGTS